MSLQIVGAGLGRTATASLKTALELLLGGPCYHMWEVFKHPEHVPVWHQAALGEPVDWQGLMAGYKASVDFPASIFWRKLSEAFPDALILLSLREPESWWRSASSTIFHPVMWGSSSGPWREMMHAVTGNYFTADVYDRDRAIEAFVRHNERVRAEAPAERLLEWRAADGWGPICERLGLPLPDEPFPHINTSAEWQERIAARRAELEAGEGDD